MKNIFITQKIPQIAKYTLQKYFHVEENNGDDILNREQLLQAVSVFDGILSTVGDKFTSDVLKKACNLKIISNYAAGLDNINLAVARLMNIEVFNVPDIVTNPTADLTLALFLSLVRKIIPANNFVKSGLWRKWDPSIFLGDSLTGKIFGIIGYGKIGKAVMLRAESFGLKTIFFDPYINDSSGVSLETLLKRSDFISLHVPFSSETKDLIDLDEFKRMEKNPILINTSRGEVVNTAALIFALENNLIRGAALDVTSPEPIEKDSALLKYENVIITPHIGTATAECRNQMAEMAATNIVNYFKGEHYEKN